MVVLVEELEVNENAFLGLSILALNQVDVRAIHVSEEGLAEVKVLRVLVDRKVLRLAKVGLLALGHHIDGGLHSDIDLSDVGGHLELELVLLRVRQLDVLVALRHRDVVDLVDRLQGHLGPLKQPEIRELPAVQDEAWLDKDLGTTRIPYKEILHVAHDY